MSSNTENGSDLERICVALILISVFIIGSLGNSVVLWVYCRRRDGQTATFFIIVLAAADLLVCLLVTPFALSMELMNYKTSSEILCKGFYFLNISNAMFSSLLISAVALDRYLCICHPMREILTVGRAKLLVCSLAVFSFLMGVLSAMNVKTMPLAEKHPDYSNETFHEHANLTTTTSPPSWFAALETSTYLCEEVRYTQNVSYTQVVFYAIVQRANHISFVSCIVVVLVCYSLVYQVVLKLRHNEKFLKASSTRRRTDGLTEDSQLSPPNGTILESEDANLQALVQPSSRSTLSTRKKKASSSTSPPIFHQASTTSRTNASIHSFSGYSKKSFFQFKRLLVERRNGERMQNFRSAAMLFVVAVVYILVFTPAILMANSIMSMNVVLFNLYYLNNVSNPVIYCFMNRGFRDKLRRILFRRNFT